MEVNNPTMESATSKMDDLRKRDDFERFKFGMLEKMSAEPKISPATSTSENTPEVINTEVRDSKIGLIKLFIQLAKDGSMDYEEVLERIDQVKDNKFISGEDAKDLKKELDVAFGKTPEQIHEAKFGLIRLFIKMAKENQMEYEEVLERIQQVKDNNFISAEDQTQLLHELDEALGRTPEQLRTSKLTLLESFISMYQKGQMDKYEVEEYIDIVEGNHYISEDEAKNLRSQLESTVVS